MCEICVNKTQNSGIINYEDHSKEIDYKKFYDENRIALLQYQNLRMHFHRMIISILGEDYVSISDKCCCDDIIKVAAESKEIDYMKLKFYNENKIELLQYQNLRMHFNRMVISILGENYYNYSYDVYEADKQSCIDIIKFANKSIFQKILQKLHI